MRHAHHVPDQQGESVYRPLRLHHHRGVERISQCVLGRLNHLVYPVGSAGGAGLGIHSTTDLVGRIRFGPDSEYVEGLDYAVDPAKAEHFARSIRRYLPQLETSWLTPDFAGIRSKLAGPGQGFRDFLIAEETAAGLPGLVNCIGIESPGLTAAGAIAERIGRLLQPLF